MAGCLSTQGIAPSEQRLAPDHLQLDAAIAQAGQDAGWPRQRWWQAFGDPQLDAWIDQALAGSPSLAEARARVRMAASLAGAAEAVESPQVDAKASLSRHRWPTDYFYGPGELARTTTWNNEAALGLSYAFDFWGRESSIAEHYQDLARMSAAQARMAQLELEGNVVRAYVQLSLQYAERDIAQALLDQQQAILDLARRRLGGGLGTQFEVSQAEVPLPETRRRLEAVEEAIALSRNQLAALAGKGPGAAAALRRPSLSLAAQPGLPARLPVELLGHRPDLVASRWQVAAEARGVDAAEADFYPNVDLVASVGYNAVGGGMLEFLRGQKFNYGIGPALSLPIFDGGRRRALLGEASASYDAAVARYNGTLVQALRDVSDQLIRVRSLARQQQLADDSVAAAQHTYELATQAYQGGLTDYLNVLNAQTRLFQQQEVAQQVHAGRLAAHAGLVIALGGGLGEPDQAPDDARLLPERVPLRTPEAR
ncbi:efflux transporter outer membrane subunit [Metapseudomonas otitidis]|uniref:efflux transporter outer membrane subunit n=1 Tax=Metapseudomonas otitidis TaxID=319939 RepID=UPI002098140F|nr:efflux transporter outer membrane subunit [Pseudomonas otitidis]MCO7555745.1 efflux transporter outer membrane subunit [Pseudomonas otitidis]